MILLKVIISYDDDYAAKIIVNNTNINANTLRFVKIYHSVGYDNNDKLYYNVPNIIMIIIMISIV